MFALVAALLLLADPAPQPPPPAPAPLAITGPARVAPYTIGEFRLANAPPKAAVLWQVSDRRASVRKPVKGLLQVVARPGEVEITAQVITLDPATGEAGVEEVTLTTTFEGEVAPVPPPAPGPAPNPGPVPAPSGALYFALVRPDGPASPEFTRAASLAEWDELRKAGHSVKDFGLTDASRILGATGLPPGTTLPCVVTLRTAGGSSTVARGPVPMPSTGSGVLDLPKGVR